MKINIVAIIVAICLGVGVYFSAYTVDETDQVVVTRFKELVRTVKNPGLHFKWPVFEEAVYYPINLLDWDGEKGEIPTYDKTYIWVDTFARWKIADPILFFKSVRRIEAAKDRLNELVDPAIRDAITSYKLIEAVRSSNRQLSSFLEMDAELEKKSKVAYTIEFGRDTIVDEILSKAQPKLAEIGIELVDVQIKRINYVDTVRDTVYERMIKERQQIAEKYRSEGRGEARKILGNKERDLKEITSLAYKTAQEIKGEADATATKLYAEAYGIDPEFYSFVQTLDTYKNTLDKSSSIVLSTDSDFLKYLKGYSQ